MNMKYSKGTGSAAAEYARGGPGDTSRSRFMKAEDVFRTNIERQGYGKSGKTGEMSKPTGDKSLKAVKPRT
jgi:hypothetical protein